jgi:hypothetical protein
MADAREPRPLEGTLAELSSDVADLVRREVQAYKDELTKQATLVGRDMGLLAAGALLAYLALLAMVASAIFALAKILPTWLASLLVGAVLSALSAMLARSGLAGLHARGLVPDAVAQAAKAS